MISKKKHLIKSAGIIGGSTFISRCLGMVRDIVCARQFGTSWQWDAFVYAFMLPNFFRRLVGEGALSSAFIPIYSETLEKQGKEAAFRFANTVFTLLACGLTIFLCLMEFGITMALMVEESLPDRLTLTLELLRTLFPYLFLISIFALGMGILHTHHHFFVPAIAPVLLNIFWIAGVLFIIPLAGDQFYDQLRWLAWVLIAAGVFQLASEIPPLWKLGFKFRWVWNLAHEGLKKAGNLILPAVLGFAVMQINILVDMTLAFIIGPGANSSLWYGTRLMQFPLGIFAIAMGTALLPMISRLAAQKDVTGAQKTITFALKGVFLIILPASIGLIVLARPIIELLFERGEFDAVSTARTTSVLVFYAIGLFAYSGQKIMTTGFHAFQDTRTPVKIGAVALVSNIVLNLILMHPLKEAGLALATSLSGILQFSLLFFYYRRGVIRLPLKDILHSFTIILIASLFMGSVGSYTYQLLRAFQFFSGDVTLLVRVLVSILVSVLAYAFFCFILRVREVREALAWVKEKRVGNGDSKAS